MSKVRVYEVARELGIANKDLIQKISNLGIEVRNHMSMLEEEQVEKIKEQLGGVTTGATKQKTSNVVREKIRPTVVRRRAVAKKAPEVEKETKEEEISVSAQKDEPGSAASQNEQKSESSETSGGETPLMENASLEEPTDKSNPEALSKKDVQAQDSGKSPVQPLPPVDLSIYNSDEPLPASVRLAHASLPPGVVTRGRTVAPGAQPLPESARTKIVTDHAEKQGPPGMRRRRELGRAALGQAGRPGGRGSKRKTAPGKKGKQTEITVPGAQKRVIRIEDQVQLQTLAQRMSLKATDVLMKLMELGMSGVHINSTLDTDTAKILANEFAYEVENVARSEDEIVGDARGTFEDLEQDREGRPPVVTVMGHVDHGKTSVLDYIRKANVVQGEAGGITQHIGAYRVDTGSGIITFLDTPGHEAFTAMRARGAQSTDIVILVVAADDGMMPQTKEAINHAQAAKVPIIVAVNKIDKPDAQPEKVRSELASEGLQPEEWGGETLFVECSALTGAGMDKLLETILLQAELLELSANPNIPAEGVVLESYLDKGRGPVANVLIRNGSLKAGDYAVAGHTWGRIRAMTDDRGNTLKVAGASTPIEVLGLSEVPSAGDLVYQVTTQRKAQEVATAQKKTNVSGSVTALKGLEQLKQMMQTGETHELKLVVKADVQGSLEAVNKALTDLSTEKVTVNVIHSGVGGINENDVMLASASEALVIGFNVRPQGKATSTAKKERIEIRNYQIIYEAIDEVKAAMTGLLAPKVIEKEIGKVEVRQVFTIPKAGTVAGSYVIEGKALRSSKARLVRDGILVWTGDVSSLRRFKEDVKEVGFGFECGVSLKGYNDIKEKDIIELFQEEEVAASLTE